MENTIISEIEFEINSLLDKQFNELKKKMEDSSVINPWEILYKDDIEDLDNLRTEKVELYKDKLIEVENLFNREWLCFGNMPYWRSRISYCSSQQDVERIEDIITIIDNDIIIINQFSWGTKANEFINRICCYDIKNIGKIEDNNISEDNLLDDNINKFFLNKFNKFKDKLDKCKSKKVDLWHYLKKHSNKRERDVVRKYKNEKLFIASSLANLKIKLKDLLNLDWIYLNEDNNFDWKSYETNNESIDTKTLKVNNLVTSVDNKIIMIKKLSLNFNKNEIKEKPNHHDYEIIVINFLNIGRLLD